MAHSPETKAAVMAALLSGQGVNEIARQYNLPKSFVSRVKNNSLNGTELEQIETQKKEHIGNLVESHLRASLKAAVKIAGKTDDEQWLTEQSADSLAVFYGVLTDKALRILEAAQRAHLPDNKDI